MIHMIKHIQLFRCSLANSRVSTQVSNWHMLQITSFNSAVKGWHRPARHRRQWQQPRVLPSPSPSSTLTTTRPSSSIRPTSLTSWRRWASWRCPSPSPGWKRTTPTVQERRRGVSSKCLPLTATTERRRAQTGTSTTNRNKTCSWPWPSRGRRRTNRRIWSSTSKTSPRPNPSPSTRRARTEEFVCRPCGCRRKSRKRWIILCSFSSAGTTIAAARSDSAGPDASALLLLPVPAQSVIIKQ